MTKTKPKSDPVAGSMTLLFTVAMVCAIFCALLSVVLYMKGMLFAGGQFTLLAVVVLVLAMQAYSVLLMRQG